MEKLERLLNLTAALLETVRPLTAEEVRSRVPGYPEGDVAFRRQFERDKEDLRAMGVPLRLDEIPLTDPPQDGYRIRKQDYQLRDPGLEPDELAALHLASSMVRLDGIAGDEAFWKLGGGNVGNTALARAEASLPAPDFLPLLFEAIAERRPTAFEYAGQARVVEPVGLHFERGHWYLRAHDRVRDAPRSFRLDRIEGELRVDDRTRFTARAPQEGSTMQGWRIGAEEPIRARVRVAEHLATWATRELGPDTITEEPDGSIILELDVVNTAAFRSFVLGFLEHAEVLQPASLREELIEWLRSIADQAAS